MPIKSLLDPATDLILEEAILQEVTASLTYRQISNLCLRIGLLGTAKFFLGEAKEEMKHYQLIADYINDRGSVAFIPDIASPKTEVQSFRQAIETAYNMEVSLNRLYEKWYTSLLTYDVTTAQFMLQFLEIQRVSIGELGDIIASLDQFKDDPAVVIALDAKLGD